MSAKSEKKARAKRLQKFNEQKKVAATRSKYGSSMGPGKVTIRRVGSDDVVAEVAQRDIVSPRGYSPTLEKLAKDAGYPSYDFYLHSPAWKALREQALERDGHRCRRCGRHRGRQLVVHHTHYGSLESTPLGSLKTMCWRCHTKVHSE